ncbi:MAG: cation transporter, partial [Naasia sp.]|nr:cation transporter [Naasia sp.]
MSHEHAHSAAGANRVRLAVAFGITTTVLVAEVVGAVITGSLALLVDAAHMLTDAGGLLVALIAATLMARPPTPRRTWGFLRMEVLAAMVQAAVLLAVGLFAFIEGIRRLFEPPEVASGGLLIFGIIGLVANVASIAVLSSGRNSNLNLRAA